DQSGGFGTFLLLGHDRAAPDRTLAGYRLFAREVMPHFQGQLAAPRTSHEWATGKRNQLFGRAGQAMLNAITAHVDEQAAGAARGPAGAGRWGPPAPGRPPPGRGPGPPASPPPPTAPSCHRPSTTGPGPGSGTWPAAASPACTGQSSTAGGG